MTSRIVLFDLGNVVVDWDPLRLYRQRFDDPADAERFCREICTMDWHKAHDAGVPMADNMKPLIAAYPEYEGHILAWQDEWMEMFHGYVPGVPTLIARLEEARTPLFALTNMSHETADMTFDAFPIIRVFRDIVVSGDERVIKPDPRIYQITLERMGHPDPQDVLFIDDRPENIEAAERLGLRGHVFTGHAALEAELVAQGLL